MLCRVFSRHGPIFIQQDQFLFLCNVPLLFEQYLYIYIYIVNAILLITHTISKKSLSINTLQHHCFSLAAEWVDSSTVKLVCYSRFKFKLCGGSFIHNSFWQQKTSQIWLGTVCGTTLAIPHMSWTPEVIPSLPQQHTTGPPPPWGCL